MFRVQPYRLVRGAARMELLVALFTGGREYMNEAHVPFVETMFRIFDAYLASLNPISYQQFPRTLGRSERGIDWPFFCGIFRYAGHGGTWTQLSGEFAIGSSTASQIVREVAAAIIDGVAVCTLLTYEKTKCIIYDLGAKGRSSDAGVFSRSEMKRFLEDHEDDFPPPQQLANIEEVGDVIFPNTAHR
ncbi:unnamed protein product [Heligmosomoides polygyrus]|uniref:DDE Tnp4 domain-containing protein n=1 Tax=Heligmosomoides polygyrus TaxID=6339 RepID=A0A183GDS9_HELPZ|nr:unnamed protein product [Heligmosomoides polygyrus]